MHVLAVDYALRPVLSNLGAAHIGQGWFVPSAHIRQWGDGGVLIDPASLAPVAQVTDEFLATFERHTRSALPVRIDAPTDTHTIESYGDVRALMSVNGLAIIGLGLVPGALLAICQRAIQLSL